MLAKGIHIIVENITADDSTDVDQCLAFSVENVGVVDAELAAASTGPWAQLPAGKNREFDFLGDRYTGKLFVRFVASTGEAQQVTVIKRTHNCN